MSKKSGKLCFRFEPIPTGESRVEPRGLGRDRLPWRVCWREFRARTETAGAVSLCGDGDELSELCISISCSCACGKAGPAEKVKTGARSKVAGSEGCAAGVEGGCWGAACSSRWGDVDFETCRGASDSDASLRGAAGVALLVLLSV